MRRGWLAVLLALLPAAAHAGPWTRDRGSFYVNTTYQQIEANRFYGANFALVDIAPYVQRAFGVYGELGLVSRWLTVSLEGQLYRRNQLIGQGYTEGMGDLRVGFWSGLVTAPVRLTAALLFGLPTGDAAPAAPGGDPDAVHLARSLPTGDGEEDVEGRVSFGYGFGGWKYWPLNHYLVLEAGLWLRTRGFAHAIAWRAEVGTKLPWKFVDRFWLIARLLGVESFASDAEAANNATGLGNGVTYTAAGVELFARIVGGLGVAFGADGAFRARSIAAGANLKAVISYEY